MLFGPLNLKLSDQLWNDLARLVESTHDPRVLTLILDTSFSYYSRQKWHTQIVEALQSKPGRRNLGKCSTFFRVLEMDDWVELVQLVAKTHIFLPRDYLSFLDYSLTDQTLVQVWEKLWQMKEDQALRVLAEVIILSNRATIKYLTWPVIFDQAIASNLFHLSFVIMKRLSSSLSPEHISIGVRGLLHSETFSEVDKHQIFVALLKNQDTLEKIPDSLVLEIVKSARVNSDLYRFATSIAGKRGLNVSTLGP